MEIELLKIQLYRLMYHRTLHIVSLGIKPTPINLKIQTDLVEAASYNMEGDELVIKRYGDVNPDKIVRREIIN